MACCVFTGSAAWVSTMEISSVKRFSALSRPSVEGGVANKRRAGKNIYFEYRNLCLLECLSSANSISRSISLGIGNPEYSHILGYILMDVNPGMVLISLI